MEFNLDDLKKVEASSIPARPVESRELLTAILKVKKADYTPKQVRVRARISPEILTCEFLAKHLTALEKDENVLSISLNQRLHGESEEIAE